MFRFLSPITTFNRTTQFPSTKFNTIWNHTSNKNTRHYWREVIRYSPHPQSPSLITFEDPTIMAMRSARAQSAEGLLRRKSKYIRYEKPWMERKRMKMVRKYKAMERGVNDLKAYVKFVEDVKKVV